VRGAGFQPDLNLSGPDRLERKRLHHLSPWRSLVPAEPFKHSVVEVDKTQEAIG
jgi:hypothetical protein